MGIHRNKEHLFVDGYNIINSWEGLKEKSKISLEEARYELMEILAEYHHYSGIEMTLVFDAYDVKGNNGGEESHKGIRVVFTKERETADHYIERTLDSLGRLKRIRVATSDRLEQEMVLARGGTRISARELEIEIQNAMRGAKRKTKSINKINNRDLGRLDDELLEKLEKWNKSPE